MPVTPEQPEQQRPDPGTARREAARREAARRRRLAEAFGEVLPEASSDERPDAWGDRERGGQGDDWLRSQVPPHHG